MRHRHRRERARRAVLARIADLPEPELTALLQLAKWTGREFVAARRAPGIASSSWISPLASLRFTDRVEIGERATIGPYCCVWGGWSTTWARVGAEALLSPGVVMVAGNHGIEGTGPVRDAGFTELDVEVGPGAWIGAHAVIVGCRVGTGAVVGANAVV